MNTETRDPAILQPASPLKRIPAPAKDGPEVCAMAQTIAEQDGVLIPIPIDPSNHILTDEGRLRWLGARRMGLAEVPVVILEAGRAASVALDALFHRGHYTKSALAYLAVDILEDAFREGKAHQLACLKKGSAPVVHSVHYGKTWEELAEKLGICRRLLALAKAVHAEFDRDQKPYRFTVDGGPQDGAEVEQTLREHFAPKILRQQVDSEHEEARPLGLGAVMKAIGSIRATKGKARKSDSQLELFTLGLDTIERRIRYYSDFDRESKTAAQNRFIAFLDALPADLQRLAHEHLAPR